VRPPFIHKGGASALKRIKNSKLERKEYKKLKMELREREREKSKSKAWLMDG
jgi:hypothetical protein